MKYIKTELSEFSRVLRTAMEGNAIDNDIMIDNKRWIDASEEISLYKSNRNYDLILYANPLLLIYLNIKYAVKYKIDILKCCLANKNMLYLRNDGIFFPCTKWSSIESKFENSSKSIFETRSTNEVYKFINSNIMNEKFKEVYSDIEYHKPEFCRDCYVKKLCTGCILNIKNNNQYVVDISECEIVKKRFDEYLDNIIKLNRYEINHKINIDKSSLEYEKVKIKLSKNYAILKGEIKEIFLSIFYNSSIVEPQKYNNLKKCLFELKSLNIIR